MITHVGFFWTDKPDREAAERLLSAAREMLSSIPGARNFRAGTAMESPRGAVDDSFDLAICMDFEDQATLQTYLTHQDHIRFVDEFVKKDVRRYVIYDIES